MRKFPLLVIAILLEAPAPVGASAVSPSRQAEPADSPAVEIFSGLVRAVGGETRPAGVRQADGHVPRDTHGRVIVFPGDTVPDDYFVSPITSPAQDGRELGALDFLSTVYEENDYYDSGYWGRPDDPAPARIYEGTLPDAGWEEFVPPVRGRVTSEFGYRERFHRFHRGIDIHLCTGDTVVAALPGRVNRIGHERGGYGHFVIVSHANGIETRYAHLQCALVTAGDFISAGQPIALGGSSGNSTGPHLHFEIRYFGQSLNPRRVYPF